MKFTIHYVDGTATLTLPFHLWSSARSDGVDLIRLDTEHGSIEMNGGSIYWLYREKDYWVSGQTGVIGLEPLRPEVLHRPGGMEARVITEMPDLPHYAVKLGWWRK